MGCKLYGDFTDTHVAPSAGEEAEGEEEVGSWDVGERGGETTQQLVCVGARLLSLYCSSRHMSVWQRQQKECDRGRDTHQCVADETRFAKRKQIVCK